MLTALAAATRVSAANYTADVIVHGAIPAGMTAAQAASRAGAKAITIEPSVHIGGLSAEFFEAVAAESRRMHGISATPQLEFHGQKLRWRPHKIWDIESLAAKKIYEGWVRQAGYKLIANRRVKAVRVASATKAT